MFFTNAWGSMLTRFSWNRKSNLMTDQNVTNLPLSCSTPLMKTKSSYGAFVFQTRQHFMWIGVLIDTTAAFGEQQPNEIRVCSRFTKSERLVWASLRSLLVPSALVRAPLLGLSISIYLNSTCFHRLKHSNKKLLSRVILMQDGAPPHFSCFVTRFKWEIPWCLDWKGWTNTLPTSKPRSLSTWFFPVGLH